VCSSDLGTIMGERLAYLPSVGFCLALAGGLVWLGERVVRPRRAPATWSPAMVVPLAIIVVLYGTRTVTRNVVWNDPLVFFQTMVVDAPRSARSHRELGSTLADLRRFTEARHAFERSLAIKPEDPTTLYNLGNALSDEGSFDEAVDAYRRATVAKPNFALAYENLGNAESMRGDQQAALAALRRALELNPDSPYLLMNVANTLFRAGSIAEARTTYEQALAHAPSAPDILSNYGTFLYAQNDFAGAVRILERVPSPASARVLVTLAASYRQLGRAAEAQTTKTTAERLYPTDPAVRRYAEFVQSEAAQRGTSPGSEACRGEARRVAVKRGVSP